MNTVGASGTTDAGRQISAALKGQVRGSVHTDRVTRLLYATDASNHRIMPDAVLVAREINDIAAAVAACRETGIPVTARGGGTSLAGQAVGHGLHLDTFHLDGAEIDADARSAEVLPGTIQRSLDRAALTEGLTFGPQTATSDRATLGGMVGNNSAGTRSIIYGLTSDRLETADVILADGTRARFGPTDASGALASGMRPLDGNGGGSLDLLAETLEHVRHAASPLVAERYPTLLRHVDGYALDELAKPQPNLARFLAGSEGTLALFTEFGVELDPQPEARGLAIVSFDDVGTAISAVPELLQSRPSAIELLDRTALTHAREDVSWLVHDAAGAVLYVEFQGDPGEVESAVTRVRREHADADRVMVLTDPELQQRAWRLRERGLAALQSIARPGTLPAFVDDTAVAPERLGDYLREFQRIVDSYDTRAVMFGHVSVGCLHIYPLIDVRTAEGVADMESMASEIVDLVRAFDGALSGEHGDGLSKSPWLERYFGADLMALFSQVKDAFDPAGLLNPGKIVDAEPMSRSLRYGSAYRVRALAPSPLSFGPEDGTNTGYQGAVEQCFGAGACRKLEGTMCPPAMATRSEALSTRARANALRGVLTGEIPLNELDSEQMREVMGTCVACKACATECPVGVDMASLKTDWLWRTHQQEGVSARSRVIGSMHTLLRAGSAAPSVVNGVVHSRAVRRLLRREGIADGRSLPELAPQRFSRTAKRFGHRATGDGAVLVFSDCFTEFFEPWIGIALEKVLVAQERPIGIPRAGCCGRTAYSQGLLEQAASTAGRTARRLARRLTAGQTLAVCEPSCLSMIRDDWKRLLPDDPAAAAVVAAARSAEETVLERDAPWLRAAGGSIVVQSHCHEQALGGVDATLEAVRLLPGATVDAIGQGCCGMAGGFGYQEEHHDLSVTIGEHAVAPAVRAASGQTVLATGFSCRTQIHDLTSRVALHPIDYLARHLG